MINEYLLIGKLGAGFFSKVYLALDLEEKENKNDPNKYYAAKAVHCHEDFRKTRSFEREIKLMRAFNHPYIIKLHSVLYAPSIDIAYMIMEWADCGTLQQAISNKDKFEEHELASIFIQIALAISYLHSKEIIHRDVKPSNILLFSDGTAKLSDFGISQISKNAETVCGTPSYQSPDLFEEIDPELLTFYDNLNLSDTTDENENLTEDDKKSGSFYQYNGNSILVSDDYNFKFTNNINKNENDKSKDNNFMNKERNINKETINRKIDPKKGDVWSLGISMYQTAYGILPYEGNDVYEIANKINSTPLVIPKNNERKYSPLFVDLIVKMLNKKSTERLSIDEVILHPFFSRFQTNKQEKEIGSSSNLIFANSNFVMKKSILDIKPLKPPKCDDNQIEKIILFHVS